MMISSLLRIVKMLLLEALSEELKILPRYVNFKRYF